MIEHFNKILEEVYQMQTKAVNELESVDKKLVDEGYCTQLEFNDFIEKQRIAAKMLQDNRLDESIGLTEKSKNDFQKILEKNGFQV